MVVVVGSSNIDITARVDRLPHRGETVLGQRYVQSFGGKGANQAVAATRAGAEVVFLTKLGRDAHGMLIERHLATQGLSRLVILRDGQAFTGIALILVDRAGDNQIVVVPGSNGRFTPEDLRRNAASMDGANVILVQMEIPVETVHDALAYAKRAGIITILNPAPALPLSSDLLKLVDILTPNESEARALSGLTDLSEAAQFLMARGVGAVVVTCGAEGALTCCGKGISHIPAFPVESIDSTGAGDAFNGALACAMAAGVGLETAIEMANAAGALATSTPGAQESMPFKREIESLHRSRVRRMPVA
ncbi:MAG: rbsK [Nitrospira sp.]|jgi:ribokinase|nr:rbsK [Nitrospira sp.]